MEMEMEMEASTAPVVMAKKLWSIVRIVFLMVRKGISKSMFNMVDLHMMLKRPGKIAGKAIRNLILLHHQHHSSAFGCRSASDARPSFFTPREYEFSCSNSPANFNPAYYYYHSRKHHHNRRRQPAVDAGDAATISAVQKVLEMLNNEKVEAPSPLILPGFGRSPAVRQLRITDSPFPVKVDGEEDPQVDKAAEEFINKFYKDLTRQKRMAAALESPYHDYWTR